MLRLVSATRRKEGSFWSEAPLARSIERLGSRGPLGIDVAFENASPLPRVYNAALARADAEDVVVFAHDDAELRDDDLRERLQEALGRYDVVGVAGNRRRQPRQASWIAKDDKGTWDREYLSGTVSHPGEVTVFGPAPAEVKLIDGLFVAARVRTLSAADVAFDARFAFHFYDLDFCRSCEEAGLRIGTWPLDVYHESGGAFGSSDWSLAYHKYLAKWRD